MYKKPLSKRRKKIYKALALTRKVLLSIYEDSRPRVKYYAMGTRTWTLEDMEYAKEAQIKRAFKDLQIRKFIETRKIGNKAIYVLTEKGRIAAIKERVRFSDKRKDGKLTLISFDIPEQESDVRDKLRYMLRDFGFKRVQLSLWGSSQDVGAEIIELVKDMGAQKWIRIFLSTEITGNGDR